MERRAYYLVIRGPLGAGKSTVASALGAELMAEVVAIDPIVETWEWDDGSEALFLKANEVAAEAARAYLTRGIPVIFDGCFYWKSVLDDLVERLPFPHELFTLKVPLAECIARDASRRVSYGEAGAAAVFAKVSRFEAGIPIDATQPPALTVRAILKHLPAPAGPR